MESVGCGFVSCVFQLKNSSPPFQVVQSIFTTCHSGRGCSYFSCYGNSILYHERVEIIGYTIQFYHKLEQPFRSYCHKSLGILYTTHGWCTTSVHQMGYPFIFNGGLQIFKYLKLLTIYCKSFNISEVSFPNLELSAYKTLLP